MKTTDNEAKTVKDALRTHVQRTLAMHSGSNPIAPANCSGNVILRRFLDPRHVAILFAVSGVISGWIGYLS